jgi:nitrogen fixation NifU-like protein
MPTRQEYIDFILDHYERPHHHGPMDDADYVVKGGNPGCGDIITLYLKMDGDDRLADVSFEGEGCTISQAATSVVTDNVIGKTLAEIAEMSHEPILEEMGRDVVASRLRCATLALNTLKAAEAKRRAGQLARSAQDAPVESF